jgi:hypothetical protein
MSSYNAEMTIGSNTYKVLDADISYYQHTRGGGMPSSEIQGGTFTVKIESSDGPQYDMLTEWMFGKSLMKEGYIRFYKKDGIGRLFDFEFYDAHCIRYHEHFNYANDQPMDTSLTISPGITRIRGKTDLVKEQIWKVSELKSRDEISRQPREFHFVEIELVGEDGIGVANIEYELTLPNGNKVRGVTDEQGLIRVERIDPGSCKITFPKLDAEAWEKVK